MVIILCVLALIVLFCVLSSHYDNPYKCTFVFGKKGSGKSCYMVRMMHKYLRKGWHVYTDMQDIQIPGVRIIRTDYIDNFKPEYHSLLCLDEVGVSMDNRNFKQFSAGKRDFFKFSRKFGVRIIINSQSYDVDKKVRDTVDGMILMQSIGSIITLARPIRRTITLTEPSADSESRIADRLHFAHIWDWRLYWMPSYHRYFDTLACPPRAEVPYTVSEAPERYARGPVYNTIMDVMEIVRTHPWRIWPG